VHYGIDTDRGEMAMAGYPGPLGTDRMRTCEQVIMECFFGDQNHVGDKQRKQSDPQTLFGLDFWNSRGRG